MNKVRKLIDHSEFNVGANIAMLRAKNNMSQYQVAARLQTMGIEMSRSHYGNIELNTKNVPIPMLVALTIIFKCNYADFFEGFDGKFK